jgi:transposase
MVMVRVGALSEDQQRELERLRRRAVGRVSQRAHMVLLNARGYSVARIAEIFDLGEDVVRQWLHRYQAQGAAGLEDCPRPGRPPRDCLARHIVDAQASNAPSNSGLVQGFWTARLLATFLAVRFGLQLSAGRVRHYLHQTHWRWARPRLAPATHAPASQRKHDPAAAHKLRLIAAALASAANVLYVDESELQLLPLIRSRWLKGPRLRVPTPGKNVKRVLFGALHARTGRLTYAIQRRKRAVDFVAFLDQVAATYASGEVVLVLDNVITHDAKLVRAWLAQPEHARFRLLWLPKYSAHEHNPIERVWGLVKDAVAANRLHGTIEALVATAGRFLETTTFTAPYPTPGTALQRVQRAA